MDAYDCRHSCGCQSMVNLEVNINFKRPHDRGCDVVGIETYEAAVMQKAMR